MIFVSRANVDLLFVFSFCHVKLMSEISFVVHCSHPMFSMKIASFLDTIRHSVTPCSVQSVFMHSSVSRHVHILPLSASLYSSISLKDVWSRHVEFGA